MKVENNCVYCKKVFISEDWANRKYCSHECSEKNQIGKKRIFTPEWKAKIAQTIKKLHGEGKAGGFKKGHKFIGKSIGEIMKGKIPWNKGKKLSYKARPSMQGRIAWNKGIRGLMPIPWNKNKPGIMRGYMPKGSKHWAWKGGVRQFRSDVYDTLEYKQWRKAVFQRDNFTCVLCDSYGVVLNADHIKPFSEIILENKITTLEEALACSQLWDVNNGRTLCKKCHGETPTYGLKQVRKLRKLKN